MPLLEIKKRLQSTQDSKKITQALELVAASKMKGFQKKALGSRAYALDLLHALKSIMPHWETLDFAQNREQGKTVFVLLTSNKGLCGTLNARLVSSLLKSNSWKTCKPEERILITIGKKGNEAARRQGFTAQMDFEGITEELTPLGSLEIIDKILSYWKSGEANKIILVSPHYVNAFTSVPTHKIYLPFSLDMLKSHSVEGPQNQDTGAINADIGDEGEKLMYLEPGKDEILNLLSMQIIHALFDQSFYELKASEYSSRMVAMKKSTDAATDIISALTLEYNKVRQSIITQQLAELATASEAMEEEELV